MTEENANQDQTSKTDVAMPLGPELGKMFGDLGKNWSWIMALGILFIVLGMIALGMPMMMTLTTVMFFGVLLLVGGVFQIFDAFKCKGWKGMVWHILIGLLYIAAALVIFRNPALSSLTLTAMLGGVVVAVGIIRIVMGFQMKGSDGWVWLVVAGMISMLLGGIILMKWPVSGLMVIGVLVAVEMIIHGWSYVFVALTARKARNALAEA